MQLIQLLLWLMRSHVKYRELSVEEVLRVIFLLIANA